MTRVVVHDKMQRNYVYMRTERVGRHFSPLFTPDLTPADMLRLGVFGGKYMTDCRREFPSSWFRHAKLCAERHDPTLNLFGVNASQPLPVWRRNGWISRQILAAGSSGIAATIWAAEAETMGGRSGAGGPYGGMRRRSRNTARKAIWSAAASVRPRP